MLDERRIRCDHPPELRIASPLTDPNLPPVALCGWCGAQLTDRMMGDEIRAELDRLLHEPGDSG